MSDIFDYDGKVEKKAISEVRRNWDTFEKNHGPFKITEKTKDITKCFHPEGKTGFQGIWSMAGWQHAVKVNVDAFKKHAAISPQQYGMSKDKGGMIVFSPKVNAIQLDKDNEKNKEQQEYLTGFQSSFSKGLVEGLVSDFLQQTGREGQGYTWGSGFEGHYVGSNNEHYDESSLTLELTGLNSQELIKLAETIAWAFFQETVLVKDYNNGKVYLVDGRVSENEADYDPLQAESLKEQPAFEKEKVDNEVVVNNEEPKEDSNK